MAEGPFPKPCLLDQTELGATNAIFFSNWEGKTLTLLGKTFQYPWVSGSSSVKWKWKSSWGCKILWELPSNMLKGITVEVRWVIVIIIMAIIITIIIKFINGFFCKATSLLPVQVVSGCVGLAPPWWRLLPHWAKEPWSGVQVRSCAPAVCLHSTPRAAQTTGQ